MATHAIVCRATREIVSRHVSLNTARARHVARAYPSGNTARPLTRWAHGHFICPIGQAMARVLSEAVEADAPTPVEYLRNRGIAARSR